MEKNWGDTPSATLNQVNTRYIGGIYFPKDIF